MDVKILSAGLCGTVQAVPSKSAGHRALICAALADAPTRIERPGESEDIAATAACLTALGARIERDPGGYTVYPLTRRSSNISPNPPCVESGSSDISAAPLYGESGSSDISPVMPCGESGSTFRFLLPIVCALGRSVSFLPLGRLPLRPLSPLYEELIRHGCILSPQGAVPFRASGQLSPGDYSLDAGVSSQFISGLLFTLPLLNGDSDLHLSGRVESLPYINMTMASLEMFGIRMKFDTVTFTIPGLQTYKSPSEITVEGDWSNAAFWLVAGAVCTGGAGSLTCSGLDPDSRQGDRMIVEILDRFGARVDVKGSSVTVSGGDLRAVDIDARDIPDLVPVLAVIGAAADGITVFRNAGRVRTKESDRLSAMYSVLRTLGADINETSDGLVIKGGAARKGEPPLKGGIVSSHGDHRIAMAAAIAAGMCKEPVEILGAESVNKSYPGFFDDFQRLGGTIEMIN